MGERLSHISGVLRPRHPLPLIGARARADDEDSETVSKNLNPFPAVGECVHLGFW